MKRFKGPVTSKKTFHDGVHFQSMLEKHCYVALKDAKLFEGYEGEVFQIEESFKFNNTSYERQANSKGSFIDRGNKSIIGIKYTPDFTGKDYIIECKGRANATFPIRWKLFKKYLMTVGDNRLIFKPQNQKEIAETIQLIKLHRNGK